MFAKKSRGQEAPFRIGINAHLLSGESGYRRAGIHNYIAQVLDHLPSMANDFQYSIFSRHDSNFANRPGFQLYRSRWPTERRLFRIIWEQAVWPFAAARQKLDLLHGMAFVSPIITNIPAVVTIYDLSFIHYPDNFPGLQRAYLQKQTARSCRQAKRIITISESGRQDVHHFFQIPFERIDVVVPGVNSLYRFLPANEVEAFRRSNNLGKKIILHVGTLQPRKNIPLLLQALVKLGRPDIDLVLAGGKGWLYEDIFSQVIELGLENQVRFTGYVPDRDLPLWYNVASMLVFPSEYEGFGLPIIEAMACGTPVVAAQSSSIPEAGGTAALYFEPGDVDTLAKQISLIFDHADVANTLRDKGKKHAAQFSWERAGQETACVYRKVLGLE